jgi:small subunit ribosomal protein S7
MSILAFNRWGTENIEVGDLGLKRYITLEPKIVPKTGSRYAGRRFHKSKIFIVERLINRLMVPGHRGKKHKRTSGRCCGTATNVHKIVEETFKIIEKKTKENPIKVFVKALENAAPREEIVTIEYGGAKYPKAVDCSPQRRIDIALKFFVQGSYEKSFNKKRKISETLSEELISAYNLDQSKSLAIQKKLELERQADGSR